MPGKSSDRATAQSSVYLFATPAVTWYCLDVISSIRRRLLRTPLFYKILWANIAIVGVGAVGGTIITMWHVTSFPDVGHYERIARFAGVAPPTLHSMGARLGSAMSKRLFNVIVTNVPGPQSPLYAGDAQMLSTYPVIPLAKGQALAVGVTSYDGGVYYGLNADRDAMPDVDVLGQSIVDSLAELTDGADYSR